MRFDWQNFSDDVTPLWVHSSMEISPHPGQCTSYFHKNLDLKDKIILKHLPQLLRWLLTAFNHLSDIKHYNFSHAGHAMVRVKSRPWEMLISISTRFKFFEPHPYGGGSAHCSIQTHISKQTHNMIPPM